VKIRSTIATATRFSHNTGAWLMRCLLQPGGHCVGRSPMDEVSHDVVGSEIVAVAGTLPSAYGLGWDQRPDPLWLWAAAGATGVDSNPPPEGNDGASGIPTIARNADGADSPRRSQAEPPRSIAA